MESQRRANLENRIAAGLRARCPELSDDDLNRARYWAASSASSAELSTRS
jgi:hypothetical protein